MLCGQVGKYAQVSLGIKTRSHVSFTVFCILSFVLSCFKTSTVEDETISEVSETNLEVQVELFNCSVELVEVNEHPKAQMFL